MSRHDHVECEHDLKHCTKCDECWCSKCDKIWPEKVTTYKNTLNDYFRPSPYKVTTPIEKVWYQTPPADPNVMYCSHK